MGFWKNKRVVVTGGAGFLGQHVVKQLQATECEEITIPRKKDFDFTLERDVERFFKERPIDIIIHLAATVGGIGANSKNPGRFFFENLMMGTLLMEYSRRNGVKKFVAVSTICAYPKFTPVPFREEEIWNGYPEETNAPYGLAKKMLLVQSQTYRQQYNFNSIVLFPVNLYGPGDNFDLETSHVMPALIRKFIEGKEIGNSEVVLWGSGNASREFIYAEDAARGIIMAAESYDKSEPVNIGSGREVTLLDLAQIVRSSIGYEGRIIWDKSKPEGQPRRCLDISRALKEFNFKSSTPLENGIEETIAWYKKFRNRSDVFIVTA